MPTKNTTSWARESLRAAGVLATAARIAVMRHLVAAQQPQSRAELVRALDHMGFDQSTLSRGLNELADSCLLVRLDPGDHVRRFELVKPDGTGELGHAHCRCTDCGTPLCLHGHTVCET